MKFRTIVAFSLLTLCYVSESEEAKSTRLLSRDRIADLSVDHLARGSSRRSPSGSRTPPRSSPNNSPRFRTHPKGSPNTRQRYRPDKKIDPNHNKNDESVSTPTRYSNAHAYEKPNVHRNNDVSTSALHDEKIDPKTSTNQKSHVDDNKSKSGGSGTNHYNADRWERFNRRLNQADQSIDGVRNVGDSLADLKKRLTEIVVGDDEETGNKRVDASNSKNEPETTDTFENQPETDVDYDAQTETTANPENQPEPDVDHDIESETSTDSPIDSESNNDEEQ